MKKSLQKKVGKIFKENYKEFRTGNIIQRFEIVLNICKFVEKETKKQIK